jgi:hypothetical protein
MTRALITALLVLGACAARGSAKTSVGTSTETAATPERNAEPRDPDLDSALTGLPVPEGSAPVGDPAAGDNLGRDPYSGVINRAGLVNIVEQGLGRFLSRLRLAPVVAQGKFVGFGVTGIDPTWGDVGLRPGDVILRVNGQPIERPEQALSVFEALRVASEIAVDLTRDGVPATLRFRVD